MRNHQAGRREMRLREREKEGYVGLCSLRGMQRSHHFGTHVGVETHGAAVARAWGRPTTPARDGLKGHWTTHPIRLHPTGQNARRHVQLLGCTHRASSQGFKRASRHCTRYQPSALRGGGFSNSAVIWVAAGVASPRVAQTTLVAVHDLVWCEQLTHRADGPPGGCGRGQDFANAP